MSGLELLIFTNGMPHYSKIMYIKLLFTNFYDFCSGHFYNK